MERVLIFVFFNQKTADERRISDWSSDVCSSDLWTRPGKSASGAARHDQQHWLRRRRRDRQWPAPAVSLSGRRRSEEHTSELQSLMRISYAVFCLKKKKHSMNRSHNIQCRESYLQGLRTHDTLH